MKILTCAVLIFGCAGAMAATNDFPCDAPETMYYESRYNEYVCEGVGHIEKNDYEKAIRSFEYAREVFLFERRNFSVFPRLAWLYFKTGNMEKAEENLLMAELTLSVYVGILRCKELEDGHHLLYKGDHPFNHIYADAVTKKMCGAILNDHDDYRTLENEPNRMKAVKRFLEIKAEIKAAQ